MLRVSKCYLYLDNVQSDLQIEISSWVVDSLKILQPAEIDF